MRIRTFHVRRTALEAAGIALGLIFLSACGGSPKPPAPVPPVTTSFKLQPLGTLPQGVVNSPYAFGLQTNLGAPGVSAVGPVTFQTTAAMPAGLTLSPSGVVSGIPAQAGVFQISVQAVDSSAAPQSATGTFTLFVRMPGAVLTQVAHNDLGGHGQNGAVRVATASATGVAYAYVGTLGTAGECPATGVKIVSLSQVTTPQLVATAGGVSGASQANVRVATGLSTPNFHSGGKGDLMAVTEQPCDPQAADAQNSGVQFYDVSDPTAPQLLGTWSSGVDGVDDVAFVPVPGPVNAGGQIDHSQDKLYALVAVPGSETSAAGNGHGDLRVLDITNPAAPQEIGEWGVLKATGTELPQAVMGYDPRVFLASINLSSDGKTAYLGYWDEGVVVLNVSDPTKIADNNPDILLNHITYPITALATTASPAEPEGNTRAALPMVGDTDLLIADQVCASTMTPDASDPSQQTATNSAVARVCGPPVPLSSAAGWGFVRTYSLAAQGAATIEGFFANPQSMSAPAPDNGIYSAHGLAWNGDVSHPHAYVAWYSAGVEDLDISSIAPPTRLASFIPPDTPDPNGTNPQVNNPPKALVDGVAAFSANGQQYILASDINSGLWIVRESPSATLTILTTSLPDGNVGVQYNAQLASVNGALGTSKLVYSLTPDSPPMPSGLTLGPDGSITGIPIAAGTTALTVQVSDGAGNSAAQNISLTVDQALAIAPPTTVPLGTTNEAYSLALTGVNGTQPYTWTVAQGQLPPGVSLNGTSGLISGTPVSSGSFTATIRITDSEVPAASATLPLTIQVSALAAQAAVLPSPAVGAAYQASVTMTNGTAPFTPALALGTLPPGLSVSASGSESTEWQFTGTPTQAGTYNFSIRVTDGAGQSVVLPFTMVVNPFGIAPPVLPTGVEGRGYLQQLTAQGGTSPYQFQVVLGSLPAGVSLSGAGLLSGVPASGSAGTYDFSIFVSDGNGLTATQAFTMTVFNPSVLAVTTVTLPPAQVGQAYSQTITADFGTTPYSFVLLSGSLPPGVTLNPSGALQGIPGAAGNYFFTVQVQDASGATAIGHLSWTVTNASN